MINNLIWAEEAKKITEEVNGEFMISINNGIIRSAKLGSSSIMVSAASRDEFTPNIKNALELKGYTVEVDKAGNYTISW